MQNKETDVHRIICKMIKIKYPEVLFVSDFYSFLSQTSRFSLNSMRILSFPDLFIAEPNKIYKGLFIEIKKENEKLFKNDLTYKTPHIEQQAEILKKLSEKGYFATFGRGVYECLDIIDGYMENR